MSAKKKRRKAAIVQVNPDQKQDHCRIECHEQKKCRQLARNPLPFASRLVTPMLVDVDDGRPRTSGVDSEVHFEVYAAGNCHETLYESAHFESDRLVVVEGTREATSCRSALTELIDHCEMELRIATFIIAMPRKRHDHLQYVGRLTNFFDFKLIRPYAGWAEDFVYVALELDPE